MGIIGRAKEIADLVKALGDIELYRKIIDLEGEIVEVEGQNIELTKENRKLKEQLETAGKMTFKYPVYYMEGDEVPFCPCCWESDRKTIHLSYVDRNVGSESYWCYQCRTKISP